jgi:hypothetical protein
MAGLLAMSTYFGGIANDYALITTYPLLMLLLIRARTTGRYGLLALGLIAIVGDRAFFAAKDAHILTPGLHLALQVAWLVLVAIEVGARWQTGPGSHDLTAGATRAEDLSNKSAAQGSSSVEARPHACPADISQSVGRLSP